MRDISMFIQFVLIKYSVKASGIKCAAFYLLISIDMKINAFNSKIFALLQKGMLSNYYECLEVIRILKNVFNAVDVVLGNFSVNFVIKLIDNVFFLKVIKS